MEPNLRLIKGGKEESNNESNKDERQKSSKGEQQENQLCGIEIKGIEALIITEEIEFESDVGQMDNVKTIMKSDQEVLTEVIQNEHDDVVVISNSEDSNLIKGLAKKILKTTDIIPSIAKSNLDAIDYKQASEKLNQTIAEAKDLPYLLISEIETAENGKEAIDKAEEIYPVLAHVEEKYTDHYAEKIKNAVATVTGSKRTLKKSEIVKGIKKKRRKIQKELGREIYKPWFEVSEYGSDKFRPAVLGQHLLDTRDYLTLAENVYRYDNGVFIDDGEDELNSLLMRDDILGDEWKRKDANDTINYIKRATKEDPIEIFEDNRFSNLINVKNGMIDYTTGELLDHSPKYESLIQLPVKYDPDAECKKVDKFIEEVLLDPEDPDHNKIKVFWEFVGWTIYQGNENLKKMLLLIGNGDNGKSVLLNFITELLGRDNTSAVELHRLTNNKFGAAELFGKIANIAGEMDSKMIENTNLIKQLTGGDTIQADQKFKQPIQFKNRAQMIFALNNLPRVRDYSEAYFNRLLIIRTPNVFKPGMDNYDPKILEKITTQEALSHALNKAIEGLKRLKENDLQLTESESINREKIDYKRKVNPVISFLNEVCEEDSEEITAKSKLYQIYKSWCKLNGYKPVNKHKLTNRINRSNKEFEGKVKWINGESKRVWLGLKIKETAKQKYSDK